MIHGVPSYHDYIRDKAGPIGRCLDCGFQGAMVNGVTGYECPTCYAMRLEFCLRDGRAYRQFHPMDSALASREQTPHVRVPAACSRLRLAERRTLTEALVRLGIPVSSFLRFAPVSRQRKRELL